MIEVIVHLAVVMILLLLYFLTSPRCNASDAHFTPSDEMSISFDLLLSLIALRLRPPPTGSGMAADTPCSPW